MRILPTIYWEPIPDSDCVPLGLSPLWRWEGLYFEWFGRGWLICTRVRR